MIIYWLNCPSKLLHKSRKIYQINISISLLRQVIANGNINNLKTKLLEFTQFADQMQTVPLPVLDSCPLVLAKLHEYLPLSPSLRWIIVLTE